MATAPKSYKDPYWSDLSATIEAKLDLPSGLLQSVVLKGERSNADQVSEAGARTPFQIIPQTRDAALKRYGIDAYLGPQQAAEVAGLLLKESLQRNGGDVRQAVGEYHGGTNRQNWGKRTQEYMDRVTDGLQQPKAQQPQSTFQRVMAGRQAAAAPDQASIANVLEAYKSGRMNAQERAEFEADVRSGAVMLPRGASLDQAQPRPAGSAPEPMMLPQGISEAYASGRMTPQERAELEADMRAGIVKLPPTATSMIPGEGDWQRPTEQGIIEQPRQPGIGERLIGMGEAGLTLATGATGGALGTLTGTGGQLAREILSGEFGTPQAAQRVAQAAQQAAAGMTYAPRGDVGREIVQSVGEALAPLTAVSPMLGEMAALGQATRAAAPSAAAAGRVAAAQVQRGAQATAQAAQRGAQAVRAAPGRVAGAVVGDAGLPPEPAPAVTTGGMRAGGAAATELESQRLAEAERAGLRLTEGEIQRSPEMLAWEREKAKTPEFQAPFLERQQQNNRAALTKLETVIDSTDAQTGNLSDTGVKVVDTLMKGWEEEKAKTRKLYDAFRNSDEAQTAVDASALTQFLNDQPSGVSGVTGVTDAAKQNAVRLGIASIDADGNLVPNPAATLGKLEEFRQAVSATGATTPNDKRLAAILKRTVDGIGDPIAGNTLKAMRSQRQRQAQKYENRAIVSRLLLEKKGMSDPQVPIEDVFRKTILDARPSEITHIKRVLLTIKDDAGKQAWNDLRGATGRWIADQAEAGIGADNLPVISAAKMHKAVQQLDKNGKLDLVMGKSLAEEIRNLDQVLQYIQTNPPMTSINNSGTARTIAALIAETGAMGAITGIPLPIAQGMKMLRDNVRDRKIKARITRALNYKPHQSGSQF